MAKPYSAPMPDDVELDGSYTVRVVATDPTTGNTMSAVTVASLVMHLRPLGDTVPSDLAVGPFLLVPGPGA